MNAREIVDALRADEAAMKALVRAIANVTSARWLFSAAGSNRRSVPCVRRGRAKAMAGTDYGSMSLSALKAERNRLSLGLKEAEGVVAAFKRNLEAVDAAIKRKTQPGHEPRITDHAILRYLERTKGIDVEAIKTEILTPRVADALRLGATKYTVNGVQFRCDKGVLTTVVAD